jgi:thiol-disulfide isomerase/thioredoxin
MGSRSRWMSTAVALLLSAGEVVAQAPAPAAAAPLQGRTPAECLQGANDARNRMVTEARNAGAAIDGSRIMADSRRLAAECAARFTIATIRPQELVALSSLYLFIGDTARARQASDRAQTAPGLTTRERGEAYLAAIRSAIAAADPFAGLVPLAEDLARQVDALPDSLIDLKLAAHQRLLGQYEYADVDDGIRSHASAIVDLVARLRRQGAPQVQRTALPALVQAYLSLSRAAADFLHPDSALAILDRAEAELGSAAEVRRAFEGSRALYALVGTRAAPVVAEHWINAPDSLTEVPVGNGKVTLIQFTAHWCAPCRNSYPGFKRVAARFAGGAFEAMLVTDIYGTFEGRRVTLDEELAADRAYYGEHWAIPFRVAIIVPPRGGVAPGTSRATTNDAYRVAGIPQIVVVDKRGIIRQIVTGWDRGNEERLTRLIEQLEGESGS